MPGGAAAASVVVTPAVVIVVVPVVLAVSPVAWLGGARGRGRRARSRSAGTRAAEAGGRDAILVRALPDLSRSALIEAGGRFLAQVA